MRQNTMSHTKKYDLYDDNGVLLGKYQCNTGRFYPEDRKMTVRDLEQILKFIIKHG